MSEHSNTNPPSAIQPVAIVGGGVSGLATAYELARRGVKFTLFEQSARFGGIIETVRTQGFTIECGPDSWVTEKPWTRELALELGLKDEILQSNDRLRRTYLVKECRSSSRLVPIPDGMRMMVPMKWGPILKSPLFSWPARLAYLREPGRARDLKRSAPDQDESVEQFVRRHFGDEVAQTIAGPLLSGIFGGDIRALSVRAVMPAFVKMEAEYGSLITALRDSAGKSKPPRPMFSTFANGLQTLIDHLIQRIPAGSLHLRRPIVEIRFDGRIWRVLTSDGEHPFHSVVLATPAFETRKLLASLGESGKHMASLLPREASSAILVALAFNAAQAARMRIPRGFGFLVPTPPLRDNIQPSTGEHKLFACTFLDQKFPHRAPPGATLLRAFFGGRSAEELLKEPDDVLTRLALRELSRLFGPLPDPVESVVRRLPLSLPQYAVGHTERIAELMSLAKACPGLHLVGNAYHGVGLSDLIRDGRIAAQEIARDRDEKIRSEE